MLALIELAMLSFSNSMFPMSVNTLLGTFVSVPPANVPNHISISLTANYILFQPLEESVQQLREDVPELLRRFQAVIRSRRAVKRQG